MVYMYYLGLMISGRNVIRFEVFKFDNHETNCFWVSFLTLVLIFCLIHTFKLFFHVIAMTSLINLDAKFGIVSDLARDWILSFNLYQI